MGNKSLFRASTYWRGETDSASNGASRMYGTKPTASELYGAISALGQGNGQRIEPKVIVKLVELNMLKHVRGDYILTGLGWATYNKIESGDPEDDDLLEISGE
jgi:hypothetical protein